MSMHVWAHSEDHSDWLPSGASRVIKRVSPRDLGGLVSLYGIRDQSQGSPEVDLVAITSASSALCVYVES